MKFAYCKIRDITSVALSMSFFTMCLLLTPASIVAEPGPNGIDFWANDRLHLPDYEASTNLVQNPSFEAGCRYWGFCSFTQGIIPLEYSSFYAIDSNQVHSGSHSLRLRALSLKNPLPLGTFPLPLNPNTSYTLSFYAKGSLASSLKLNVWGRGRTSTPISRSVSVNGQWQRYTIPFTASERFVSMYFDAQLSTGSQESCIWLDDIQLDSGSVATEFKKPPIAAQMVSAARGNFLQFGQDPNFNLIIQSQPDANGTVSLSVEDFFFNNVFGATYQFTTDHTGKSTIVLDKLSIAIRASNLRGVFIVTGVFNIIDVSSTYTDYFRFSVMDFLDNSHKNKDLFNIVYGNGPQSGGPEMARFLARDCAIGFGSINYDFFTFANDLDYALDEERMQLLEEYGFGYMGRAVLGHDKSSISEANGLYKMTNINNKINPSSFFLGDFANICRIKAQNRPWNNIWWFCGESNPGCEPLESDANSFAKFLLATNQGIKAGNLNAKVLIEGGPWKLDAESTAWVERYIQDTKRIDPTVHFDGAAAHHYRNFPENPDLDSDIATFLAMLDRNGCGNWPFYINEGGNYCPFNIPEEGISPYVVQSGNAWYMGPVSYHSGQSERIVAAFNARNWLVALKYQNRLACMADNITPNRYMDIDFTPRLYDKIPNTLSRILGNASFVRDIQFAPNCRGYLFRDDATGSPIAAIWGYKQSVDRWQESPPRYTFDFDGQNLKFIDLMENEVTYPKGCNGRTVIPLSPFPLFIKGIPGTETQLCDAITNYANNVGAPETYMDGSFHNGSLTAASAGNWYNNPSATPAGWAEASAGGCYQAGAQFVLIASSYGGAVNNTGELVQASYQYTVSADLGGGSAGSTAVVSVYATQNSDGTGTKVLLASVSRINVAGQGYNLYTTTGTPGSPASPSLAGYYVQVNLHGGSAYYDNIVVTSQSNVAVPVCCGDSGHPYPNGDLNHDCYVNWQDLVTFADRWLAYCAGPNWCSGADLNRDANVKLNDLAVFAAKWLNCIDPNSPCSYNP